jgi:ribonuclease HI
MTGKFRKKTNHDWWERLESAAAPHKITWEWVKGHAGHDLQEAVDKLARKTAEKGSIDRGLFDETAAALTDVEP